MQHIEFEATTFQHTVHIPENIPDGVSVKVVLSFDESKIDQKQQEELLSLEDNKNKRTTDKNEQRRKALAHIAAVNVDWQGKPIENRDQLYDELRG